jgi:diacylglycerol kinase family enzyme
MRDAARKPVKAAYSMLSFRRRRWHRSDRLQQGAQGTDVPVGIVPNGTGNILAHETGIIANPPEIARMLVEGRIVPIQGEDLANGEPFLLMASAGFDGRVTAVVDRRMQRRFGKAAYTQPVLKALFHPLDELDVTIDNVCHQANWVIVTNS